MDHPKRATVILDVRPILRGSEKAVVEAKLGRRPGVERVEANPVAQTATVVFDPAQTSLADLRRWVEECACTVMGSRCPSTSATRSWNPSHRTATATTTRPPSRLNQHHQPSATVTIRVHRPLLPRRNCGPRTR